MAPSNESLTPTASAGATPQDAVITDGPLAYADFDLSYKPQDDFYHYCNKGWMDANPIPADKTRYGAFEILADKNDEKLRAILDRVSKADAPRTLLGDFYAAACDQALADCVGLDAIRDVLDAIDKLKATADVVPFLGSVMHKEMIGRALFEIGVAPDAKDSETMLLSLEQSGLGLPDRDYYFAEDKESQRVAYKAYIGQLLKLADAKLGDSELEAAVNAIYDIEKQLAESTQTRIERRDVEKMYNKQTADELRAATPNIPWAAYFKNIHFADEKEFNNCLTVDNPAFFKKVSDLLGEVAIEKWRWYLRFHALRAAAPFMSKAFVDASFEFELKTLNGQAAQKPLWKRIIGPIGEYIPDALSKVYVEEHFPAEAKAQLLEVAHFIGEAFRKRIAELTWMEDVTKSKALEKLDTLVTKIGYPDKFIDYRAPVSRDKAYYQNLRLVKAERMNRDLNKAGKPVDKSEWYMPAFMVNAYYNPQANEHVYPAAILQPPFFYLPDKTEKHDAHGSELPPMKYPALTFGGIGMVISHENSHSYDDQGRAFDARGNMTNWWTEKDDRAFKERVQVIIEQYDAYKVHGVNVKGQLTQGENVADLGGCKLAFYAMQDYCKAKGITIPDMVIKSLDGKNEIRLTPEQQFFASNAILWRHNITKENALLRIETDPHAPGVYRVNGPMSNLPEFWNAFNVSEGAAMRRPADKLVDIW
ncbi:hypothetical protein HDU86_003235 [Geranomyces michiganensis]|nr:hypothetical protein HDU86_003235 [Geranomyces michiganensis]